MKRLVAYARAHRRLTLAALIVTALVLIAIGSLVIISAPLAPGYIAKRLCGEMFVCGRDDALRHLRADNPLLHLVDVHIDRQQRRVSTSFLGLFPRQAVHRPPFGAVLLVDAEQPPALPSIATPPRPSAVRSWPVGDAPATAPPPAHDRARLAAAVENAFTGAAAHLRTRALLVHWRGHLIAERYAPGFDRHSRLPGWSMSKGVTNALAGILVGDGALDLDAPCALPWWPADDPRAAITPRQLLRMTSGLDFWEFYAAGPSDVLHMLFGTDHNAAYAAGCNLDHEPGTHWSYATGDYALLSAVLRRRCADDDAYHRLPFARLFGPLGMTSAIWGVDAAGDFQTGSFCQATARDWARFGIFLLQDGIWDGRRLLPAGWMAWSTTPTPGSPSRWPCGAGFWLNAGAGDDRWLTDAPADCFTLRGHFGQYVSVIPSRDLVVVRLGLSKPTRAWDQGALLRAVLAALAEFH